MKSRGFRLAVLVGALTAAAPSVLAQSLRERIEEVTNAAVYKHALWGILVADAKTGERVYGLNEEKLMRPASVTKLFSVAAALEAFGPDHRFRTPVFRNGALTPEGVLRGDLILVASGDPTLGGRTDSTGKISFRNVDHIYAGFTEGADVTDTDPLAGLKSLAKQVSAAGIRRITGDVIVDDRLFDHADGTGSGPGKLTPIVINDNVVDVVVTPGQEGKAATVRWIPESPSVKVESEVMTGAGGGPTLLNMTADGGRILVRGQIAAGRKPIVRFREVDDPADFARSLFIEALAKEGVRVVRPATASNASNSLPASDDVRKLPKVAELISPPFTESAKLILKVSHNLHSGLIPLLLAAREGRRNLDDGLRAEGRLLRNLGVPVGGVSFGSSAGGSQADFASPAATVELLRRVSERPYAGAFADSLPVLGVDGTLWDTVPSGSVARGKVNAKTGTYVVGDPFNSRMLLTSKALAGYLDAKSGRKLVFAIFVNNVAPAPDDGDVPFAARHGRVLGRLCEILHDSL